MSIGLRSPESSSDKCDYCTPDPGDTTVLDHADVCDRSLILATRGNSLADWHFEILVKVGYGWSCRLAL
ncbi:hypothetical protein OUZ56_005281 [Daphnia magna]|uniref:Uncharacterized protein n=1 Tax=Daphnia magna TaxID=35525 RepID=A0ABQ9YSD8_9CRUS|nr:hypothetical protein OUZ56_005281 [Daphnia magna]